MLYVGFLIMAVLGVVLDCRSNDIKLKRTWLSLLVLYFCFLAANRSQEIPDTEPYTNFIIFIKQSVQSNGVFYYSRGPFEVGFEFVIRILVSIGLDYKSIFFCLALAVSLLGIVVFSDKKTPIIIWLVFISFYGIYFSFVILRAGISIMCFSYFVRYHDKKIVKSIVFLMAAFLFHASVLFGVLVFLLCKLVKRMSLKTEMKFLVLFFIIYVFSLGSSFTNYLLTSIDKYISFDLWKRFMYYVNEFNGEKFQISFRLIVNIFVYCLARWLKPHSENPVDILTNKMVFFGIIFNLFLGSNTVVGRMVDFLWIFNVRNYMVVIQNIPRIRFEKLNHSLVMYKRSGAATIIERNTLLIVISSLLLVSLNFVFILRIIL